MTKPFAALVTLFNLGCATAAPNPGPAPAPPVTSAIIFVPGYYGSTLNKVGTGDRFFITAGRYLFGSDAVSLMTRELATPRAPDLEVGEVIDRVRVVPGIYSVDVYGAFMDSLARRARESHAAFEPFAYDWRQDLSESAARLAARVRELRERGVTDVRIVAHSMGCLVTAYYLGYGDQPPDSAVLNWAGANQVTKVVLMAGPYRGASSLFRNMQTGAKIGSNTSYLPAETVASLPASYQLLPVRDFHLLTPAGQRTSLALDTVEAWERLNLGLLKDQTLAPDLKARRREFTLAQLARARTMATRLELRGAPPPEHLKILQLVGRGRAVVDAAFYDADAGTFGFDTDRRVAGEASARALFRDGDGSVTTESARLPDALRPAARIRVTEQPHDRVFEDTKFARELGEFLK